MVAFEMTRQLLDAGEKVAFLGLLDPTSLQGDLTHHTPQRLPAWLNRLVAFGGFFVGRLRLYREKMQALRPRQKLQFIRDKLHTLRQAVEQRDVFRGDRREFYQRRVSDANLHALLRYHPLPLAHGVTTIEIFRATRDSTKLTDSSVDWQWLAGGSAPEHKMPGKDSGDMLNGQHAHIVASHLAIRLGLARMGYTNLTQPALQSQELEILR
jgi:thioesterase domain-containing protein